MEMTYIYIYIYICVCLIKPPISRKGGKLVGGARQGVGGGIGANKCTKWLQLKQMAEQNSTNLIIPSSVKHSIGKFPLPYYSTNSSPNKKMFFCWRWRLETLMNKMPTI